MSTLNATNLKNPSSGSNNIVLATDGSTTIPTLSATTITGTSVRGGITSATAVASTSGTSIDFTGIPSWVKRVTVMLSGVSTSSTSLKLLQLGDSGGIETTGYTSGASNAAGSGGFATSTGGFVLSVSTNSSNAETMFGAIILTNVASNTWVAQGAFHMPTYLVGNSVAGGKALSDTLDRVRITTVNGTDTFDAGSINILMEG